MRRYILAALLAGTIAAPAYAQVGGPFTGFRVEGLVGYDMLKSGEEDSDGQDTSADDGDESIDGASYGVGVGYDFNVGGLVAGVEAEYAGSTGEQEADETIDDINFSSSIETGRDIYVGGRIGFLAAPTTLLYAKGGYTNTNLEFSGESVDEDFEFAANLDGYRLGAGVEQMFGPNMYAKAEYRYSNYGNLDFNDDFDLDDDDFNIDVDRHQIMAGLGFRF